MRKRIRNIKAGVITRAFLHGPIARFFNWEGKATNLALALDSVSQALVKVRVAFAAHVEAEGEHVS